MDATATHDLRFDVAFFHRLALLDRIQYSVARIQYEFYIKRPGKNNCSLIPFQYINPLGPGYWVFRLGFASTNVSYSVRGKT